MKFSVRPQYHRVTGMLEMIRAGGYPNCTDFVQAFCISRQTAMRDLDFLRDEWKAPITYDASRKGYFLADPAWTLPAIKLDRSEVFALGIARRMMPAFRGTPLEAEMQAVLARVADSLEGHISMEPAALAAQISVVGEDYAPQDPDIWLAAARYTEKHEQVRMRYLKFNGHLGTYTVDPYHLAAYHGDWYLLAFHHRRQKTVPFAVSRIRRIEGTGRYFDPPQSEDFRRLLDEGFGITGGDEIMQVRLKFSPQVAPYIAGRIWHPTQQLTHRRDGSVELRLQSSGWKELVRFVLSWLPDVQVLTPEALRDRIREKIEAAGAMM